VETPVYQMRSAATKCPSAAFSIRRFSATYN
jgi:hypothetical protein